MKNDNFESLAKQANDDHVRKAVIEKVAMKFDVNNALMVAGIIGASVIVSQAVNKLVSLAEEKGLEKASPDYFKQMLDKNPKLATEDPEEVLDLWSTLYRTAPYLASDPVAAGGFITQNIQGRTREDHGGPTLDTYKMLFDINKSYKDTHRGTLSADPLMGVMAKGLSA